MLKDITDKYPLTQILENEETAYAITDNGYQILWSNKSFQFFCKKNNLAESSLISCFKGIKSSSLENLTPFQSITIPIDEFNALLTISALKENFSGEGYFVKLILNDVNGDERGMLQKNLLFQKELQNILTLLVKENSLDLLVEEILLRCVDFSKANPGIVILFNENAKEDFYFSGFGEATQLKKEEAEKEIKANLPFITRWLSVNRKPLLTVDHPSNIGYSLTQSLSCSSLLITPCFFETKLLALIIAGKPEDKFDPFEISIIEQFGALLTFSISSIRTRELNTALENRLLQAQKLETIGKLSSGMAHDFSNLLSSIFGSLNLLRKKMPQRDDLNRLIDNIDNCAIRARDLTKGLLSFGKPTSKRKELVKPNDLLNEISKVSTQTFPAKVRFVADIPPTLYDILGNGTEIYQVLLNLCINAKEAIEDKGEIMLSAENITVNDSNRVLFPMLNKGNYVNFSVKDNGAGIAEENIRKIFDPYFSTKSKESGSGLGLYVTYGIIKAHSGHVEVSSSEGKGTTFDVYIPSFEPEKINKEAADYEQEKIILLADDELMLRDLLAELLESNGYNVIKVSSGKEALTVLTEEIKVNLLIIDYNMPEMNGIECIREVRKLNVKMPIILSSGSMSINDEDLLKKERIESVLTKPYDFDTMLETIEKLI
jgi:signal transduction histidine kinase/CheY-like chemotaxis protein